MAHRVSLKAENICAYPGLQLIAIHIQAGTDASAVTRAYIVQARQQRRMLMDVGVDANGQTCEQLNVRYSLKPSWW
ncbi:hypothetical protein Pfra02_27100 [Pseudomonas fragi]|nr:hypothetical protein Pfra02_27100 [Pseudomonas fragi]